MEQKRIKVRLTENSPHSEYGYYKKGDIGYIDGYVNGCAVIILENGKFAKAELRWIEVVNAEDKNTNTEPKVSEDERIRKTLITVVNLYYGEGEDKEKTACLYWLERQGEHKKFRDSIQVGDKVTRNEDGELVNLSQLNRVAKKQGEQKPANWFQELEDKLANATPQQLAEWKEKYFKEEPAWSEEDETTKNNISHIIRQYDKISKRENQPCYYVGDCLLWMQNIKDRVQPQPKQEWSEEDRDLIEEIISHYRHLIAIGSLDSERYKSYIIPKLKSLRPQKQWKPSKAMLDALKFAKCEFHPDCQETMYNLNYLYKEIEKLYYDRT